MNMLADASVITQLVSTLAPYSTAAFGLVGAVIATGIGLKWVKGWSSKAS